MSKKIFLDTNIVADIIDAKRVNHLQALQVMEKLIENDCGVCISEDMITTLFYISKSKTQTLEFFKNVIFVDWEIINFGENILRQGVDIALSDGIDLEDTLQCLCAKQSGCKTIITNDSEFYDCGLKIMSSEQILDSSI